MKIMILTVTAGYGHNSTAKALENSLTAKGAEVAVVDILERISRHLQEGFAKGYLFATTKVMRRAYRVVYTFLEQKDQVTSKYAIQNVASALLAFKCESFIDDFAPDAIICTHITAAQIMNELKRRGRLSAPVVGIITDYTIHPFWEDTPLVDKIVTASDLLTHRALSRGIKREQIAPLGIPVQSKFVESMSKHDARVKLGLDPDASTVLIMGGSMGYGNMKRTVDRFIRVYKGTQVLAVCGNNRRQYEKLISEGKIPGLYTYGFVDNIDVMMDAADCLITKPGGLTVTEALVKALPMVLINPIPGQEERNIEFLLNNGMAMLSTKTFPLDEALYFLFSDKERLRLMEECIKLYRKPNAANDIADLTLKLAAKR